MKKSIKFLSAFALLGTMFFTSCNETEEDVTPIDATKPVATVSFDDNNTGSLTADVTVTTSGDSAYIALGVNTTTIKSTRIYLVKSEDNGITAPLVLTKDLVGKAFDGTGNNYDFDAKTTYYEIPAALVGGSVGGGSKFKLNIPLALRKGVTSAKSDVYTLWITNGAGDLTNPGKNRVLGNAVITFKYTNSSLINNYATTLGNHKNSNLGSLFATIDGTNYQRDVADSLDSREKSVDFAFVTTGTTGTDAAFLFGSLKDATIGVNTPGSRFFNLDTWTYKNDTKFATTSVSKATFDAIDDEAKLLAEIPSIVNSTKVSYSIAPANTVFAFVTAGGKKGLILVKTASGDGSTSGSADVQVKVQR